jgi:hypothetical protein
MAWPIVGEGCAGPPSLHIFSFQLWHERVVGFADQRLADTPFFLRTLG